MASGNTIGKAEWKADSTTGKMQLNFFFKGGSSKFLRNIGNHLKDYRKPQSK